MGRDKGFSDPAPSSRNKWKLRCYRKGKQKRVGFAQLTEHLVLVSGLTRQYLSSGEMISRRSFSGCSTAVVKTALFAWSVVGPARVDSTRLVFVLFIEMFSEC